MAAHPPALLPRLHARAAFCVPLRTCSRASTLGENFCQVSSSKSSAYTPACCSVCVHDVWSGEARASESSRSQASASVAEDPGLRKASVRPTGEPDEACFLSQRDSSPRGVAFSRENEDASFEDAFTRTFAAATDASSSFAAGRLQTEDAVASEAHHTGYCVPVENVSTIPASSDDVDVSQSALAASSQTRSKVVRTAWEALVRWSRSWRLLNERKATDSLQRTKKVVVIGGGSFGTAMAVLLARNKSEMHVSLLVRDPSVCESINNDHINRKYFPKHILPHNIVATIHPQEAFKDSEYCIHAVPVQYSADLLKSISEHVPPSLPFFSVSKGLELTSLEMMSQVIPRALGNQRQPVAVISGPSFSIELMDELPTAMVVASKDKELARTAQQLFASHYLRINTSSDVVGVEIAGALKNVLAIAAGIVEGMKLGNNCMAALVAQGCSEIRWLAEKMGAKSTTLAGLSGSGDIMLTCFVNLSRNRSLGVRLGSGEALGDILSSMNQVAEGVPTAGAVIALARKYRVQMPVLTAVARILENELTPKRAVLELMSLPQVEEV